MVYQYSFQNHTETELLHAIVTIESYPQFADMVLPLKKELQSRFDGVKPNKMKIKIVNDIKYYPSGLVKSKLTGWPHYKKMTTLEPFKVTLNKTQTSPARAKIIETLKDAPIFYRYLAYGLTGLKFKKYINLANLQELVDNAYEIEKLKLKGSLEDDAFSRLYNQVGNSVLSSNYIYWDNDTKNLIRRAGAFEQQILHELVYKLFNSYRLVSKELGVGTTSSQAKAKKKYYLSILIPSKQFMDYVFKRDWHSMIDSTELDLHFDTFSELIEQLKSYCLKLNPKYKPGLKMLGFDVSEKKD